MAEIVDTYPLHGCTAYTTADFQTWLACPDFDKGTISLRYTGNHDNCRVEAPRHLENYITDQWPVNAPVLVGTNPPRRIQSGDLTVRQRVEAIRAYNLARLACHCQPKQVTGFPAVYSLVPVDFDVVGYIRSVPAKGYFS